MTTFKSNRRYPTPITVTDDTKSHTLALQQIIEALNIAQRRTKDLDNSFVRLSELVDVGLIEIVNGQLKLTNLGSTIAAGGASALADLTDVDLTGLGDGDTLVWDSGTSTWVPGTSAAALNDLTDVDTAGVADGDALVFDSGTSTWVPGAAGSGPITGADMYDVSLNDLADVAFSDPQDGDALVYDAASGVWTIGEATYSPVNDGAAIARTTDFTVTAGAFRLLTFDTELRDDSGYYTASANDRFTVPESGWYVVSMTCQWNTSSSTRGIWITKNTDPNTAANIIASSYTNFTWAKRDNVSGMAYLSRGDTVYFYAYSDSTTSIAGATQQVYATIHRLGVSQSPSSPQNSGATLRAAANIGTFAAAADRIITWDTEAFDDAGYISSSDLSRLTVPESGWYVVSYTINSTAAIEYATYLYKNGARIAFDYGAGANQQHAAAQVLRLNAGDYIQLAIYPFSTMSVIAGSNLSIHRLGVPNTTATQPVNDGARVSRAATQSIATASNTAVQWDTEDRDDNNYWSSTANTRFTIPAAGWYQVEAAFAWAANANGSRRIYIAKNGDTTNPLAVEWEGPVIGVTLHQSIGTMAYLNAGDYVEIYGRQDSGGNLNLSAAYAAIHRLGASSSPGNPRNDGAEIYNSASQSIPNNASSPKTSLIFDTEVRDDGGYANLTANNDRFTIPRAGWYIVTGTVQFDSPTGGNYRALEVWKNGSVILANDTRNPDTAGYMSCVVSAVHYFAAGDYVQLRVYQESGVACNTYAGTARFGIHRLGTPESTEVVNDQFFNPMDRFEWIDDFISRETVTDQGWATGTSSGGSVTNSSENKHPGTLICATSSNNAGYGIASLSPSSGSIFAANAWFFTPTGSDELNIEYLLKFNLLFVPANPGAYRIGFIDQVTSYLQFAYFDLSHNGQFGSSKGGSGNQSLSIGSPVVANTWHRMKVRLTSAAIYFYVDDVLVASQTDTTKFPTGGFTPFIFVQNQGGAGVNHQVTVDYVRIWGTTTRN